MVRELGSGGLQGGEEEGPGRSSADSPATKTKGGLLVRRVLWLGHLCGLGRRGGGRGGQSPLGGSTGHWERHTPQEWATESPCPCALPDAQPAPDEQAAGWGGWGHVRVPCTRPGKASLPTSRQVCPSPGPRSSPRSFPHLSPWRRRPRSAHLHLSLFIFGYAEWHVGSSVPSQDLNLHPL